jgi:ribosomal protein S18 acetylase RimI-like enzyme
MPPAVRPARPDDEAAPGLLYESAAPYYDVYAGSERRARRMIDAIYAKPGHTASWEISHVAEIDGRVVGLMAIFAATEGDRLARRFLAFSFRRMPLWRWPLVMRHLRASAAVIPTPPSDSLYVDALAVTPDMRRQGIASELLRCADVLAIERGCTGVALDTGLQNTAARALYERHGFEERDIRRAPDARVARAVGGPGFVSYFKPRGA